MSPRGEAWEIGNLEHDDRFFALLHNFPRRNLLSLRDNNKACCGICPKPRRGLWFPDSCVVEQREDILREQKEEILREQREDILLTEKKLLSKVGRALFISVQGAMPNEGNTLQKIDPAPFRIMEHDGTTYCFLGEFLKWAEDEDFSIPSGLREQVENNQKALLKGDTAEQENRSDPVRSEEIISRFRVFRDEETNEEWWKVRMRAARRNGLIECRSRRHSPGRGNVLSYWHPDKIATWLCDRREQPMTREKIAAVLRQYFPACADVADLIDHQTIE